MSGEQNWRTEITASDYFGRQKKQLQVADRRPVIRKASDLVGPGIGASAVRITDFNDTLATYNGYYSAAAGAANAPSPTEAFIGQVVSDSELGGEQSFRGLVTGNEYHRVFLRNPSDSASITWGSWLSQGLQPTSTASSTPTTAVPSGVSTYLNFPSITTIGPSGYFLSIGTTFNVLQPGIYTGYIAADMSFVTDANFSSVLTLPNGPGSTSVTTYRVSKDMYRPFTFAMTSATGTIRVSVQQVNISSADVIMRGFSITRIGDVPAT